MKGSSSVQCCLRPEASQPGGASGSHSFLPTDYEQAAKDVEGQTDLELAALPELTQFSLPDAGFVSADKVYDSYSWR